MINLVWSIIINIDHIALEILISREYIDEEFPIKSILNFKF